MQNNPEKLSKEIWEQTPWCRRTKKTLVDVEDASHSLMTGISTDDWDDIPSPGLMFCHTSPQEFLQTEPINDEVKEAFLRNKRNANIMHGCWSRIYHWWKLVPFGQQISIQLLHQRRISVKHQRCTWRTIPRCTLKYRSKLHQQDWWPPWILE